LQNIQKAKYPELTDEAAVKCIRINKTGVLALDQKDAIKNYFKSRRPFKKMN
jgi:hypothetical protein